jgi:hypothetical protein
VIGCAALLPLLMIGLDLDIRIEIFVKIALAGFVGIYDATGYKSKN